MNFWVTFFVAIVFSLNAWANETCQSKLASLATYLRAEHRTYKDQIKAIVMGKYHEAIKEKGFKVGSDAWIDLILTAIEFEAKQGEASLPAPFKLKPFREKTKSGYFRAWVSQKPDRENYESYLIFKTAIEAVANLSLPWARAYELVLEIYLWNLRNETFRSHEFFDTAEKLSNIIQAIPDEEVYGSQKFASEVKRIARLWASRLLLDWSQMYSGLPAIKKDEVIDAIRILGPEIVEPNRRLRDETAKHIRPLSRYAATLTLASRSIESELRREGALNFEDKVKSVSPDSRILKTKDEISTAEILLLYKHFYNFGISCDASATTDDFEMRDRFVSGHDTALINEGSRVLSFDETADKEVQLFTHWQKGSRIIMRAMKTAETDAAVKEAALQVIRVQVQIILLALASKNSDTSQLAENFIREANEIAPGLIILESPTDD